MKSSLRAKRMARNHRLKAQGVKLNLTSLMDIFTILVFFLMINSGDIEVLQSDKNIKLPDSLSAQKPDLTLLVKISETDVIIQGQAVATIKDVLSGENDAIASLENALQSVAERKPLLNDLEKEKGRAVTIIGGQQVPYKLLKLVMAACAQTDYRDISLAVNALPGSDEKAFIEANRSPQSVGSSS